MTPEDFDNWLEQGRNLATERESNPEIPDPWEIPPEAAQLEAAIVAKEDQASYQHILESFERNQNGDFWTKNIFSECILIAIDQNRPCVVRHLVDWGVPFTSWHFRMAMQNEAYDILKFFLDKGYELNDSWSDYYSTPLGHVIENERLVTWLLDHGANPNAESRIHYTPLSMAVASASFDTIKLLFDRGGPESIQHGELLVHVAGRERPDALEVLDFLLSKGASNDVNKVLHYEPPELMEEQGVTIGCTSPLLVAARKGNLKMVQSLVAHGADPMIPDGNGQLAIDAAREGAYQNVVDYLAAQANASPRL